MKRLRSRLILLAFVGAAARSWSAYGGSLKVRGSVSGDRTTPAVPDTGNRIFLLEKR